MFKTCLRFGVNGALVKLFQLMAKRLRHSQIKLHRYHRKAIIELMKTLYIKSPSIKKRLKPLLSADAKGKVPAHLVNNRLPHIN